MKFEDISTIEELKKFLTDKHLEVREYDNLIKIDDSHFMKFEVLDELTHEIAGQKHREFKRRYRDVPYLLIIDKDFTKFFFLRDYGTPWKFTFDRQKEYAAETLGALSKKLNGLKYSDSEFNESLNNLFDVKEIVKKFYDEYEGIREKLGKAISNLNGDSDLYAQILLDRIIFLYFLQTKSVGSLQQGYLSGLYFDKKSGANFYKDYLKPLFFEILNTEHDLSNDIVIKGVNFGRIPYLNGGLFSMKKVEEENPNTEVKDSVWKHVFKLLDGYEWVIEEERGDSTTLTPSILGHIYEKSVIAATQKETGSYYTPNEITEYISKNTIYPYICDRVNEKFSSNYKNIWNELLDKKEYSKEDLERIKFLYFDVLKKLTVLDPAVGSGAFLIAAQQIMIPIYWKCINALKRDDSFRGELAEISKHHSWSYFIKRCIITNNLYGVDIQEGAVEICKLRLWLSMVSEMELKIEDIEPLPNIDYNILCGNSLIGFVEPPTSEQTTLVLEKVEEPQKRLLESKEHQMKFGGDGRSDSVSEILMLRGDLIRWYKEELKSKKSSQLKGDIERISRHWRAELDKRLLNLFLDKKIKITDGKKKRDPTLEDVQDLQPFHWGFEYYDVMQKGGFDIVIGNPPYVDYRSIEPFVQTEIFNKIFYSCKNTKEKYSLYIPFIESGLNIITQKGYFCYINPSKWLSALMAEGLREFIKLKFHVYEIVNLAHMKVFPDPTFTNLGLFFFRHKECSGKTRIKYTPQSYEELRSTPIMIDEDLLYFNSFIVLAKSNTELSGLLSRIESVDNTLKNDITLEWGSSASGFRKKKISKEKFESLEKSKKDDFLPVIQTSNVKRYKIEESNEYAPKSLYSGRRTSQFSKNKIVIARRSSRLRCAFDSGEFALGKVAFTTQNRISLLLILPLLNSKLVDFWFKKIFESLHPGGSYQFDIPYLYHIPIPSTNEKEKDILIRLSNYMLTLGKKEDVDKIFNYLDTTIVDSLVYELYLGDELKTNLLGLVEPYLVDVSGLKSDKEKIGKIKEVVGKLQADGKVMAEIKKIKENKYVKIIEESQG